MFWLQRRLCWKIDLIRSHSMRLSFSAHELSCLPRYIFDVQQCNSRNDCNVSQRSLFGCFHGLRLTSLDKHEDEGVSYFTSKPIELYEHCINEHIYIYIYIYIWPSERKVNILKWIGLQMNFNVVIFIFISYNYIAH